MRAQTEIKTDALCRDCASLLATVKLDQKEEDYKLQSLAKNLTK